MSRSHKQRRSGMDNTKPHKFNHNNKTHFKHQNNKSHPRNDRNNNTSRPFVRSSKQQQQQLQQKQENEKTLPLPNGPLFERLKLVPRWKKSRTIGPGFVNGQNTCFLNSVLECLTYTPPLAQYFLYQGHRKQCTLKRFCAMCAMDDHVHRCLEEPKSLVKGAAILPRAFTSNLRAFSQTLRLGRQEDAHEFMMFLLDAMHKSTIQGYGKLDAKVERTAFIHQIFGGQLQSQLRCHSCNAKSNTFDNFLDLSVDLQQANSVQRAMENFIKVDMIGGSDPDTKYRCESCKQKVNAGKQMTIHQLPSMLCVHLKRFTFDMMRGYMRKVTKDIQYTETLDMAPYVSKEVKCPSAIYQLYAVLVHLGYGCDSGHYFAYVKAPDGKWFRMDDEDVSPVSLKEVLSQQAYMLFYTSEKSSTHIPDTKVNKSAEKDHGTKRKVNDMENASDPVKLDSPSPSPSPPLTNTAPEKKIKRNKDTPTKKNGEPEDDTPVKPTVKAKVDPVDTVTVTGPPKPFGMTMDHYSDGLSSWIIAPSNRPFRSLRGNMSPPTFTAAVSDVSAWSIVDQESNRKNKQQPLGKKWLRRMKSWNVEPSQ
ncbi:unnamed protein product [Absidia cylindrospora]